MGEPLRVLDLFSGIGGFSLGLERTGGFKTAAFCEIESFCRRVLAKHWPEVPCHPDVEEMQFRKGDADVISAGFPCQDISLAGLGAGLAGARSGLYRHVVRAVRLVRPAYALLENVAALLSRGMGTVLGDLAEIGYDAEWHCIPASTIGAPHRRDRVWIVAHPGSEQHKGCRPPLSGTLAAQLLAADSDQQRTQVSSSGEFSAVEILGCSGEIRKLADAESKHVDGRGARPKPSRRGEPTNRRWWATEPDVGRVAHGVPARVDRLRGLGNAVVPQIPELIGRAILEARPRP